MDNIVNQSVAEAQLSKARVRLVRLREALKRVDEDEDFGLCVECGDPIPMARLKAMPETEYCVECCRVGRFTHFLERPVVSSGTWR